MLLTNWFYYGMGYNETIFFSTLLIQSNQIISIIFLFLSLSLSIREIIYPLDMQDIRNRYLYI